MTFYLIKIDNKTDTLKYSFLNIGLMLSTHSKAKILLQIKNCCNN